MGFLDHSTNNIIVDAVLTSQGRQALAEGRFRIDSFSLADDEVDYTLIEKFGRTVGKEKIIKNTPIFEAQTLGTIAMKHRLVSFVDPTVVLVPTVQVTGDSGRFSSDGKLSLDTTVNTTARLTLTQNLGGATSVANIPIDSNFYVYVPHRFLKIVGRTAPESNIEKGTQTAMYAIPSSDTTPRGLPILTFTVGTQGLDDTVFNTFGTTASKNRIDCVISVTGQSTGLRTTIPVIITKT